MSEIQGTFFGDLEQEKRDEEKMKNAISQDEMKRIWKEKKKHRAEKNLVTDSVNYGQEKVGKVETKEVEKVEILWGPAYYPLPGQYRRDTDASERVPVYFGSDCKWYVDGKESFETYALELIESDETREDYKKIVEDIRKIIKDNKKS